MSALTCHAVTEFPIANGRLSAFSSGQSPSVARSHIGAVKNRIRAAQVKATLAANAELIHLYWDIGRAIAAMQEKEGWGAGVIPRLARDITNDLPEVKGFSERNLKRIGPPRFWPSLLSMFGSLERARRSFRLFPSRFFFAACCANKPPRRSRLFRLFTPWSGKDRCNFAISPFRSCR